MAVTIPFEPGNTWRQLGYLYFTNSLEYRRVIEQNPQWNVTELPPIGAALRIEEGTTEAIEGSTFLTGVTTYSVQDIIYPYEEVSAYTESLNRYTTEAITQVTQLNGYSQDDRAVYTGNQSLVG